jgi:hypothetical protein
VAVRGFPWNVWGVSRHGISEICLGLRHPISQTCRIAIDPASTVSYSSSIGEVADQFTPIRGVISRKP